MQRHSMTGRKQRIPYDMRLFIAMSLVHLVASLSSISLEAPVNNSSTIIPTPHFSWSPGCDPIAINPQCSYSIQIATDIAFTEVVLWDTVEAVITRFVPAQALPYDVQLFWRIGTKSATGQNVATSAAWSFRVTRPTHVIQVPATASFGKIQDAFEAAESALIPTLVQFDAGIVRTLDPGNSTSFLSLSNCSDVVVDFNGARLTFSRWINFVSVTDSQRIAVLNATFDLDPLPYTALHVKSVDKTSFSGTVAAGHPNPELLHVTIRNKGEVMDGATTRTKRGLTEVIPYSTDWNKTGNLYKIGLSGNPASIGIANGDVFVMGERTGPTGFSVVGSNEVVLLHIVAHACANECFTSAYTDRLSILHCGLVLLPGRFKAANDGGHNHHSARIGAWIEAGDWQNTGDDICHVSGLVFSATKVQGSLLTLHRFAGDQYSKDRGGSVGVAVGDILQLYDHKKGIIIAERRVTGIANRVGEGQQVNLEGASLENLIRTGTISSDPTSATQIFNLNASATQFVFRRNRVSNGRRFGVLAKGNRILVSDNMFIGLGNGAVQFLNSPFEGLCARHAVVSRNSATDVMQLSSSVPRGAYWTAQLPARASGPACHQDLLFEDNIVDSGPHSAFSISGAQGVSITNSQVSTCKDDHATGGYPTVYVGSDTLKTSVSLSNTSLEYSTVPRVCAKGASLVRAQGSSLLYFLNIMYSNQVSQVLHPVSGCVHCGDNLCTRLGVHAVTSGFVTSRVKGASFTCALLPGPRIISTGKDAAVYFQATPTDMKIYHIGSCRECPGDLCSRVIMVPQQYFQNLVVASDNFKCTMI